MFRAYFVSEMAQVELRSGRVQAPAGDIAEHPGVDDDAARGLLARAVVVHQEHADRAPLFRDLHSYTLEFNLSTSRTHS